MAKVCSSDRMNIRVYFKPFCLICGTGRRKGKTHGWRCKCSAYCTSRISRESRNHIVVAHIRIQWPDGVIYRTCKRREKLDTCLPRNTNGQLSSAWRIAKCQLAAEVISIRVRVTSPRNSRQGCHSARNCRTLIRIRHLCIRIGACFLDDSDITTATAGGETRQR